MDFLLSAKRKASAAERFFRKTLKATHTQMPRVINVDKNQYGSVKDQAVLKM